MDKQLNYSNFIFKKKTILIAPAGYGKTYALAECLKYTKDGEKQLILTHTHAGIAAIKEKIKKLSIPISKYHIETITGFSQKFTLSFYCKNDIPSQEDAQVYYPFVISVATQLFRKEAIKRIVASTYQGLFVDEYQDCTLSQHNLIMLLSEIIPTHILGDPLQGIFSFNEELVNFDTDLLGFEKAGELTTPWRWICNENNSRLGNALTQIRTILTTQDKTINFSGFSPAIEKIIVKESDIFDKYSTYRKELDALILNRKNLPDLNSLLLIVPEYFENNVHKGDIISRSKLKAQIDYSNQLILLEAIDNKDFYKISKKIDEMIKNIDNKRKKIKSLNEEIFCKLFNKGCLDGWISENNLIKKKEPNLMAMKKLESRINAFLDNPSISSILSIILFMKLEMKFKTKRLDLLNSLIKSMNIAIAENKSVYEGMVSHKNVIRRFGKKIYGKCIGTTLLTKGLEFDTVAVLNAHRFTNHKHFYVAITRACKRLIIFSESESVAFN